jgi:hypothetical protein
MYLPHGVRMMAAALLLVVVSGAPQAQQQEPIRIEKLVADGWDVTGFIAVADNRSVILFKHKEHHYLVQCSVLVDAMRNPRVVTYCYELR